MAKRRILIVEDHPLVRLAIGLLVSDEPDLDVCGECDGSEQAITAVRERQPDLVLIDLSLRSGSGLELCKHLAASDRALPMLVVSAHAEELYADRALRAGARGYIQKDVSPGTLIKAIPVRHVSDDRRSGCFRAYCSTHRAFGLAGP